MQLLAGRGSVVNSNDHSEDAIKSIKKSAINMHFSAK